MTVCVVPDCGATKIKGRGRCNRHYQQWRKEIGPSFTPMTTNAGRWSPDQPPRVVPQKGVRLNTGRTHFKKGQPPPNQPRATGRRCEVCGEEFTRHGRTRANRFCSHACQGKAFTGAGSPRWNGGLSHGDRVTKRQVAGFRAWRRGVLERDGYACVLCGARDERMDVDHIKPVATHPDLVIDVDNGRTLCVPCHRQTPTYGARPKAVAV